MSAVNVNFGGQLVPIIDSKSVVPFIDFLRDKTSEIAGILASAELSCGGLEQTEASYQERLRESDIKIHHIEQEFATRFSLFQTVYQQWNLEQQEARALLEGKIAVQSVKIHELQQESHALVEELAEVKKLNASLKQLRKEQKQAIRSQEAPIAILSSAVKQLQHELTRWLISKVHFAARGGNALFSDISETSSAFTSPYTSDDDGATS